MLARQVFRNCVRSLLRMRLQGCRVRRRTICSSHIWLAMLARQRECVVALTGASVALVSFGTFRSAMLTILFLVVP
jgi:hypothetical protein